MRDSKKGFYAFIYCIGSVKCLYACIYWKKWRFGQVLPMPDTQTDRQTTEDRATQLLYSIQFKLSHAIFSLIFLLTGSPQRGPSGGQPRVGRWEGLAALGRVPRLAGPLGQPGRTWRTWPEQPAEDLEQDWERGHPVQPGAKRGDLLAFGGLSEPHPGVCALLTCPPKKIITVNQP